MSPASDDPAWRWSNLPIPEPHVAGLVVGGFLHVIEPLRIVDGSRWRRQIGLGLIGLGLGIIWWAVRTLGGDDIEHPRELVTAGPFAHSRNPMYVGWTVFYLGIAMLANSLWHLLAFPAVAFLTHREVREEERALETIFGESFRDYRRSVRRYR